MLVCIFVCLHFSNTKHAETAQNPLLIPLTSSFSSTMEETRSTFSCSSPTIIPESEELLAELWDARMVNPYASAERIRQYVLGRCKGWEVSLKRVKKMMKDYPYLHTIPLGISTIPDDEHGEGMEMTLQRTMDKEALRLLLYELTMRENTFLNYVPDDSARMWMPTR